MKVIDVCVLQYKFLNYDFYEIMLQDHRRHDVIFLLKSKFLLEAREDYLLKSILNVEQLNEDPFNKQQKFICI